MKNVVLLGTLAVLASAESCEEASLLQGHRLRSVRNHSMPRSSVLFSEEQAHRAMEKHKRVSSVKSGPVPACFADLRASLPACMQYTPDWCWATVTAQLAGYFDPTHNPESGDFENLGTGSLNREVQRAENCLGEELFWAGELALECRVVGSQFAPSIMDACCSEDVEPKRSSYLCDTGADVKTIEKAIDWATSQSYTAHEGALTEDQLVHVLNKGHPVPYAVLWVDKNTGMYMGGHIMLLGGCTGDGKYYLHDSLSNLTRTNTWQALTHAELLEYSPWAMVDSWPTVEELGGKPTIDASNDDLTPGSEENQLQEA
eukprot:s880_g17.t1